MSSEMKAFVLLIERSQEIDCFQNHILQVLLDKALMTEGYMKIRTHMTMAEFFMMRPHGPNC